MSTLAPHLTSGMISIFRERPDDPIAFMATFLEEQSVLIEQQSREAAVKRYHELLEM
jgi:hypothetical protein